MAKKETDFFREQVKPELERRLPGCVIIKQDPNTSFQGVPDHIVLWEDKWATLESKRSKGSVKQPNQPYYVEKFNEMSFSAFINPDNMDEVLDALQSALRPSR